MGHFRDEKKSKVCADCGALKIVDELEAKTKLINKQMYALGEAAGADEEAKRWSKELDFLHTEYGADCSGCDSGDPLDCVEVEIRQAIENVRIETAKICAEIARNWRDAKTGISCCHRLDIEAEIKEKFGLEI